MPRRHQDKGGNPPATARWTARWRPALREVRLHPSRFAAIVLAVVLSVGLLVSTQVFAATEASAIAKRAVLYASRADVVVDSHVWNAPRAVLDRDRGLSAAEESLGRNPAVTAVERFSQLYVQLGTGQRYANVMLNASPRTEELRWYSPSVGCLPSVAASSRRSWAPRVRASRRCCTAWPGWTGPRRAGSCTGTST